MIRAGLKGPGAVVIRAGLKGPDAAVSRARVPEAFAPGFGRRRGIGRGTGLGIALWLAASITAAQPDPRPSYSLDALVERALRESPALAVSAAETRVAAAGVVTARAYPNPEIGLDWGRATARGDGTGGPSPAITLSQPIENPWLREARVRAADTGVRFAQSRAASTSSALVASIRARFLDVVRLKGELQAHAEDLALTEQILDRVAVRVRVGESPRFDLVRAESEVAVARKNLETGRLRLRQASLELRALVGPTLEDDFDVRVPAQEPTPLSDADRETLALALDARNPEVLLARELETRAQAQLELERRSLWPQLTLRASQERDPATTIARVGAFVTVPLLNRREGPIGEAQAQLERARLALAQARFDARASFDAAWAAYRAAGTQVQALEGGILERARSALAIAEAAYRLGERGILEYLDAQRQFRFVRNELIAARVDRQKARAEIARLTGS